MWSAEVHVRRTTSPATQRVVSCAELIACAVSNPTQRVLTISRPFAATGLPVEPIQPHRAQSRARSDASIRAIATVFPLFASPGGDATVGLPRQASLRSPGHTGRCQSVGTRLVHPGARWHEACTAGPAIGTRYAAVESTLLKEGSFANRFFDMRSHDGAGFLHEHHGRSVVGGSASCPLNIHKSKKVCRRQGGHAVGPRPLRTRPTGKRP